ncbi:putative PEP-binding protein [Enterovibrio norvegicus]|uniref:putative PEP-binding protein n=1 Tax=Enterovibrio norvegicus TaxID=188144 RepID=UPI000C838371|nr:putative PEP-binding protein [Enterovibrio norvegicus]MCC4796937.1 phosphoenolpyruvate synthase [Enterovibrio norvegicus]PMH65705.1 phosphoenolpyruvate synthase [Enterovibrio norvegicus]PMI27497.1 phosphoenolpyruvate synthase [Enterovibrio norvegicus]TKF13447.1 phosphoenolpyruvate synthase [Enterovibrio norvegicus]TKF34058.1 phosphoenolpyruvate synthase [Enterovibrio norvegicus]
MSQMELTYSHVLKTPSQLENNDNALGLIALGDLYASAINVHPASLDDSAEAVAKLVELIETAHKKNPDQPLRIMLNHKSSLELRQLVNSEAEAEESNPDMGLRGVSRYVSDIGRPGFVLECEVLKTAIMDKKLPVEIVVPFVRTSSEAATMIDRLAERGLCRGANGLKVHLACQLPANALLAEPLLAYFDGIVVDVDNLAALTLGVDFGNDALPYGFNKHNEAVRGLILDTIRKAQLAEKPVAVLTQQSDTHIIQLAEGANVEILFQ